MKMSQQLNGLHNGLNFEDKETYYSPILASEERETDEVQDDISAKKI